MRARASGSSRTPSPGVSGTGTEPSTNDSGSASTSTPPCHGVWVSEAYDRFGVAAASCTIAARLIPRWLLECMDSPTPYVWQMPASRWVSRRSEEHTSELQSRGHLVCRLLL